MTAAEAWVREVDRRSRWVAEVAIAALEGGGAESRSGPVGAGALGGGAVDGAELLAELLPATDGGGGGEEEEGELPATDGEGGGEEEEGEPKSRRGEESRGDQNRMWDPGGKL
eukprot:SAG11_NODE_23172_length_393_cov_20.979592_1_plen_112_part_01